MMLSTSLPHFFGLKNSRDFPGCWNKVTLGEPHVQQIQTIVGSIGRSSVEAIGHGRGLGPRISRLKAVGRANVPIAGHHVQIQTTKRGILGLGSPLASNVRDLGQRILRHRVVGNANVPKGGLSQVRSTVVGGLSLGSSSSARIGPERRRSMSEGVPASSLRRVRAGNKLEDEREESMSSSSEEEEKKKNLESLSGEKKGSGFVERVEAEMDRQFGGALWFSVLLFSLAVFGGGYAFLIFNYADFSDIPILNGPQR